MTTVVETYGVPPAWCAAAAAEMTMPLSFLDISFVHYRTTSRLVFYDYPTCSEAEFLAAIVPNLKRSLSLALQRYLPVAGNLLYPIDTDKSKPVIRYVSGDSVPFTFAVSTRDFDELAGSHPRDSDQFYEFLPAMPPLTEESDYMLVPLIALQATLFPNRGICVGLANHHCLGDARSIAGFVWEWAEINKRGGDKVLSGDGEPPPLFDRSVLGDCSEVNEMYWNVMRKTPLKPPSSPLPTNRFRASFTLLKSDIEKLKNLVLSKNPDLARVSSFVVTAAYTWSCVARSGGGGSGSGEEVFVCAADVRGRRNALVDPPPPANYFGNCVAAGWATLEGEKLAAADGGFVAAAVAIADTIENQINDGDNFLKGCKDWASGRAKSSEMSRLGVTGSPKFDLTKADFGWGKGRRVEVLSMDGGKYAMSVSNSWDSGGGLVVGLSLPRERMDAVAAFFQDGLLKL